MRSAPFLCAALALVSAGLGAGAALQGRAQEATPSARETPVTAASKPPAGEPTAAAALRQAAVEQIAGAREELVALAGAIPADKYSWRPRDGVRSVGEVYMHLANANYLLPTFWGVQPPAGLDRRGLEKQGGDKAKVLAALNQSFDHLRQAIEALPDASLGKSINFFGRQVTLAWVLMQTVAHAHEHLGQSIAYARMNGVAPPWSAPEASRGR
jgi:uncharacterized damage-inducible protein DinB